MNQNYIQKQKEFQDAQKLTQLEIQELQERQKFDPIYSPRTSLKRKKDEEANLLSELLLKLDPFTISILNNDFDAAGGQLKVDEFVVMMRHHLTDWKQNLTNREQKLNICLINLFEQMDIDLNGLLEWGELANFVMGKATSINNKRKDVVKHYSKQDVEIHYKVKSSIIKKVIYISDIDKVAFFEEGSNIIQFMNHENGSILPKPLKVEPDDYLINSTSIKKDNQDFYYIDEKIIEIKMHTHILDAIYISDKKIKCLMVSSTDKFIRSYKYVNGGFVPLTELKNNQQVKIQMLFKHEVNCMSWDDSREILFCGELDGSIELWNLNELDNQKEELNEKIKKKEETKNFFYYKKNVILQGGHTDIITCLLCLPKLQLAVSAGLDCKIILWDTIQNKSKLTYKGHTRGVTSLAYDSSTILLFSAGFDHWIGVWNPYTDHMVYKIADYRNSLQHILVIEGSNQLISLDIKGNVKVRDIQRFKERQNFCLDQDEHGFNFNPVYFAYLKTNSVKLVFCGQSIAAYNYDYGFNPNVCDDIKPLCCVMNTRQLKFYTPAGPRITIWCALTGEVDKIFLDLSHQNSDITAFCFDFFEKRMIIGDRSGYVNSFNCENGAKLISYPKLSAPVIFIKDCRELEVVVIVSSDNIINIVSNTYIDESNKDNLQRQIKIVDHFITCIDIYVEYNSIVIGFFSGQIGFFDISTGKFLGQYQENNFQQFQVTDILSLPDIPFVIASNQNGAIKFISGPPLFYKFQVVESFQNVDQELYDVDMELEDVGVSKIKYCQENEHLFVADFKGYLKCYDISKIMKNLNENIELTKKSMNLKEDKHTLYKGMREYFSFSLQTDPIVIWNIKATSDQITFLDYNKAFSLLIICTNEKNVMIFDSNNGHFIDQLKQNEDNFIQNPIGYRMKTTIDLYDHSLKVRIDRTKEEDELIERQRKLEYLNQLKKKMKMQKKLEMLGTSTLSTSVGQSNLETENSKDDRSVSVGGGGGFLSVTTPLQNSSKGIRPSQLGFSSAAMQYGISEIKEEANENDIQEQTDDQGKNIFLTNPEKKFRHSEVTQIMGGESIRSIEEANKNDESSDDEGSKNDKKILDDRVVFEQYPESEFNAFFYCNLIKKEPYNTMKSKPWWKLELNINEYYQKYLDKIREVELNIFELEKKTKVIQIRDQKFKIIRFEVDLNKFDPQKDFQPKIAIAQKGEVFNAEEEKLDAKVIAANYQKRLQQKQSRKENQGEQQLVKKINYNQMWENLSKNKINCRNYDSQHFLKVVKKKTQLVQGEEEKLVKVYQALRDIEIIDRVPSHKDIKIKKIVRDSSIKRSDLSPQNHSSEVKESKKTQKESIKVPLEQKIVQGRRELIKLRQQQKEQTQIQEGQKQQSPTLKSKVIQETPKEKDPITEFLEMDKNKLFAQNSLKSIYDDDFGKQAAADQNYPKPIQSIDEMLINSTNKHVINYVQLRKLQKQEQILFFGHQQPVMSSQQHQEYILPPQIQDNHSHQHSVSTMIAQAFSLDHEKDLDMDAMVKRITNKYEFDKSSNDQF